MPALMVTAVPFPPDAVPGTALVPGASSRPESEIDSRRQASHNPEILYVELWVLPVLFSLEGELMTALHRWFGVLLVVSAVPGCGVLIFIIGPPSYQCLTMLLIVAMSFQLRIRNNRGRGFRGPSRECFLRPGAREARARSRRVLNSARASGGRFKAGAGAESLIQTSAGGGPHHRDGISASGFQEAKAP
nr:uncharacterized protein LOC105103238 isoform X2 [Camelus dromedarius]XP_031295151.1 uncharacterized protein LOC105103238 isoform X2 [Camelus dromedarius]